MSDNDWKDLEIGNIPSDFFVNERYEIEYKRVDSFRFEKSRNNNCEDRHMIVRDLRQESPYVFRYRLKPLESIRITKEFMEVLRCVTYEKPIQEIWKGKELIEITNRKVEIIGDNK